MTILFSFLFSEALVQLMKNQVNDVAFRLYFEKTQYLFFTEEAELVNFNSFPSGHTAVAFAIAASLLLNSKNKKWTAPLFLAALLMGISRMYLAQHSVLELVVGALSVVGSGLFIFCLAMNTRSFTQWFKKIYQVETGDTATAANMHSA